MPIPHTYYYNGQIRNYIAQVLRCFGGIQVQYGVDRDKSGQKDFRTVSVKYGDMERLVAQILYKNSVFQATALPLISGVMTELSLNPDVKRSRNHRESVVRVRESDGIRVAHERLMGVPMKLGMEVSIYTSNNNQMLQILEQVLMLFNPYLTLQKSDNLSDWSYLTRLELTNIANERNTPTGQDDRMIVQTLSVSTDIWLNFPEKQYAGVIN